MAMTLPFCNLEGLHFFGVITTQMGRKGVPLMLTAICQTGITTFQFNDCGCILDERVLSGFAENLENSQITQLYLPYSKIGDKGALVLAKALEKSKVIDLNLQGNAIGVEGSCLLVSYLLKSKVAKLDLLGNNAYPLPQLSEEFGMFLMKVKKEGMELLIEYEIIKKPKKKLLDMIIEDEVSDAASFVAGSTYGGASQADDSETMNVGVKERFYLNFNYSSAKRLSFLQRIGSRLSRQRTSASLNGQIRKPASELDESLQDKVIPKRKSSFYGSRNYGSIASSSIYKSDTKDPEFGSVGNGFGGSVGSVVKGDVYVPGEIMKGYHGANSEVVTINNN
jgi:hypothetical protein